MWLAILASTFWPGGAAIAAAEISGSDVWQEIAARARGKTVYFNAWGGDPAINRYIEWVGAQVASEFDIRVVHVKVTDIAETVARIRAERLAGRDTDGTADLLWINGENFAALKHADLLWGPWTERLPNADLIDWQGNPTTLIDATLSTDGYELPWGTVVFTLFYDRERVHETPVDPDALLEWVEANPGRFTYPRPPSFIGTAFLKQMLLALAADPATLQRPPGAAFADVSAPLWNWLDRAHGAMWRGGRLFPASGPAQRELLANGEIDWMVAYNPAEASRAIADGELPASIEGFQFGSGAVANSHFLAIPYNASATAAAMVVANFLVSPQAQQRKADLRYWGDPTVLDFDKLDPGLAQRLRDASRYGTVRNEISVLPEPHPEWAVRLEAEWQARYTRQ